MMSYQLEEGGSIAREVEVSTAVWHPLSFRCRFCDYFIYFMQEIYFLGMYFLYSSAFVIFLNNAMKSVMP